VQQIEDTEDLARHVRSIAGDRGRGRIVVDDDPALALVRAAKEDGADVLIVGNAGMAGRKEFLLGNVPNRISHNAHCTVIIVKTGVTEDGANPSAAEAGQAGNAAGTRPSRLARGARIAAVFAKHGILALFASTDGDGATGRRRHAQHLRAALAELGPTFAKIGQMLSTRPDLLPPEFIEELSQLQNRVPPLSEAEVVRVMEQDLGVPWEDVFETIEPQPLAAGTIAQVHRASLSNGDRVVVKVQRPDARGLIEQDLALLKLFGEKVGVPPGVRRSVDMRAVFEHLSAALQRELDFRLEARNADRLRAAVSAFPLLAVPGIYADFSTSRLLVMQDVGGVPATEIPAGPLRTATARQLIECFSQQVMIDGFFHADPHPGNLMWQPSEQRLYFLDLGLVGEVDADMREMLLLLVTAFWQNDADFVAEVILMFSGAGGRIEPDLEAFRREIGALTAKYRGASVKDLRFGPVLQEAVEISLRSGVALPASLTLGVKALAQMQVLDPELDPFDVAGRYLTRALFRRMFDRQNVHALFYQSQKLKVRAMRVFEAIEVLVGARPGQRDAAQTPGPSLDATLRQAGRQIALGIAAGAAVLASALSASPERVEIWVPVAFGVTGAILMAVLVSDLARRHQRNARPETTPRTGS
jgi:predicted unusual protein kinase regulating ubiquinone biosynthesis (AarF/ABC1/UbiB family)